jgi:hypothetical protein
MRRRTNPEAIYRRYAIVDEVMLREAGTKLAALGMPRQGLAVGLATIPGLEVTP